MKRIILFFLIIVLSLSTIACEKEGASGCTFVKKAVLYYCPNQMICDRCFEGWTQADCSACDQKPA